MKMFNFQQKTFAYLVQLKKNKIYMITLRNLLSLTQNCIKTMTLPWINEQCDLKHL